MNALEILQHAYESITKSHPDKNAFEIVADVESIASRIAKAAQDLDASMVVIKPRSE